MNSIRNNSVEIILKNAIKSQEVKRSQKPKKKGKNRYIKGLDGLRAISVLSVIAYHLNFKWASGGLLGVTVFFVLSGYLITDLLILEWNNNGKIDLKHFWIRRAKRLLPGMLAMLVVVMVWIMLFNHSLLMKFWGDTLYALLYISNWWYIFQDLSYFEKLEIPSLLTHFWSLAVEEQFYIIWPLLICLWFHFRLKTKLLFWLTIFFAIVSALAMALMYQPGSDPSRIYYGTDTRAFSLLIGAGLAFLWPNRRLSKELPALLRYIMDSVGGAGLFIILFMIWNINEYEGFLYRGGMILLSIAAALLVAVLAHPASNLNKWLSFKPLSWIGVRSYGIYLWHYPVIVLTSPQIDVGEPNIFRIIFQLALIIGLASLSWELIENPIRNGIYKKVWNMMLFGERKEKMRFLRQSLFIFCLLLILVTAISKVTALYSETAAEMSKNDSVLVKDEKKQTDSVIENKDKANDIVDLKSHTQSSNKCNRNSTITAIGDSVLIDVAPYLKKEFPNIMIDAKVGRQMQEAANIVKVLKKSNELGSCVIIELGTNGSFSEEHLSSLIELIGSKRDIILVNVRVPRPWEAVVNSILNNVESGHPNAEIVDWYSASAYQEEYFAPDGIHLNEQGSQMMAFLIAEKINK
ncbi:acyltransferase family protein [Metabacillus dongyingensis]|uniref:acyltransferase family protein n=1 Tax=Metabacillus dongyingensis TaxID=2874282 RepID=UPI001CBB0159|nr:acyltransferase family protein [Metabacillus dongyingensis]UAL53589.1 acetyltransferase [Metabacillus dongyingensis]